MPELIIVVVLVVLVLVVLAITVVRQDQVAVIERFGRFRRLAGTGLNIRVPVIDRVRARVDLREQVLAFPRAALRTADGHTVAVTTKLTFQVVDAQAAIYGNPAWLSALERSAKARVAEEIAHLNLTDALRSGRAIAGTSRAALDSEVRRWGIAVNSMDITAEPQA